MDDIKQQMLDHMNEHWAGDPPLEGQADLAGGYVDPNSPYARYCEAGLGI